MSLLSIILFIKNAVKTPSFTFKELVQFEKNLDRYFKEVLL